MSRERENETFSFSHLLVKCLVPNFFYMYGITPHLSFSLKKSNVAFLYFYRSHAQLKSDTLCKVQNGAGQRTAMLWYLQSR